MTTERTSPITLDEAQARFHDLAEAAKAGEEAIVTKDGQAYIALIDADSLAYYHRLARERLNGLLIQDAIQGLEDVAAGRTEDAYGMLRRLRQARAPQS